MMMVRGGMSTRRMPGFSRMSTGSMGSQCKTGKNTGAQQSGESQSKGGGCSGMMEMMQAYMKKRAESQAGSGGKAQGLAQTLEKMGVDDKTSAQLQEMVKNTIAKGADEQQVHEALNASLQQAVKDGVKEPEKVVEIVQKKLSEIEGELAQKKLKALTEQLSKMKVGKEESGKIMQTIEQVIKNGADANQVADEMMKILDATAKQEGANPKQVLQAMAERLGQINNEVGQGKLQNALKAFGEMGVNGDMLKQVQQGLQKMVEQGVQPGPIADVMMQIVQLAQQSQGKK